MFRIVSKSWLVLGYGIAAGCAKEPSERAADAALEQQRAVQAAEKAASDTQREISAANRDAAEKSAEARREASERVGDAIRDGSSKVADARNDADAAAVEAAKAFQEARSDLRKSVDNQLEAIDERVVKLQKKLDETDRGDKVQVKTQVSDVAQRTQTLRNDLQSFEKQTAASVDEFRVRLDRSLAELKKKLEELESRG